MPVESPPFARIAARPSRPMRASARNAGHGLATAAAAAPADVAPSPPAERRQVAILFADLSGYTHLSSTLDAEEVHRLLTRFFELVDGVISRLGGTIDKHIGDAVMAVFGAPVAHGNDTERALRAAGEIHAAMATLTREFARPLAAHIGIASGEVVAADTGSAAHRNYTMTGDAVNLAARLVELARAGETVISDDVHRALAHVIDAEPQGTVPIRGLGRELPVWKLRALRAADAAKGHLIGRDDELRRFARDPRRCRRAEVGATVLVCADPGMGKTRLAEEFLAMAACSGFARHAAAVLDFGAAQGRDAIHQHLLQPARHRRGCRRRGSPRRAGPRALPMTASMPPTSRLPRTCWRSRNRIRRRYEAMDNVARTEGKLHALVDGDRTGERAPSAAACCWSRTCTGHRHGCTACLAALASCAQRSRLHPGPDVAARRQRRHGGWPDAATIRFDLAPLANADALALARTFLTANPDVALRCVERAQGNPLFLTQLLRSGADGATIPGTIQSVVLARLDRPAAAGQGRAAGGIRPRASASNSPCCGICCRTADYDCATLQARDLVRREARDGGHWMFGHALIRDGAYASVLHSGAARAALARGRTGTRRAMRRCMPNTSTAPTIRAPPTPICAAARAEAAALRVDSALRLLRRGAELDAPPSVRHALAALEANFAAISAMRWAPSARSSARCRSPPTTRSAAPRGSALPPGIA